MKNSVAPVWPSIVTLLLAAGLFGCSSSAPRPMAQEPITIVEAEPEPEAPVSRPIRIKENHPRKYTVKKGDTLWGIASLFLKDPWYWPEIWQRNPQVQNPHLIYPGDILTLIYIDGQPQILVNQPSVGVPSDLPRVVSRPGVTSTGEVLPVVKLSPSIREESLRASIPSIPGDAIRQFTTRPRVVTKRELEQAPYILASDDEHLVLGEGNRIYVRGEIDKERVRFTVFRPGEELNDPDTGENLGYEAIYAGEAHISKYDDPAIGTLTRTEREVLIGDRLLPIDKSNINNIYFPRLPDFEANGRIISLTDALFGIAKFQVAVVNLGARSGLEVGHLLATHAEGKIVRDRFSLKSRGKIGLPNERSGLMMIFRTFDRVSYGLVLESTRVIHNHDYVRTPR